MRTVRVLACLLVLAVVGVSVQSGPVKIFVTGAGTADNQDAQTLAKYFENKVAELLAQQYTCAVPATAGDLSTMLKFEHDRQVLDPNADSRLPAIAQMAQANYVISLTVTPFGSGQVNLQAKMMPSNSAQAVAMMSQAAPMGNALQAVDDLAKRFVQSLGSVPRLSKTRCEPTNRWTGVITYKLDKNKHTENGGYITDERQFDEATVRVGWTGQPVGDFTINESLRSEHVVKEEIDCARSGIGKHTPVMKSLGYRNVDAMELTAGALGDASVSVDVRGNRYTISVTLPHGKGVRRFVTKKHADGGCGKPSDSDEQREDPWEDATFGLPTIQGTLSKPNELQGTTEGINGGRLTWTLTRTPMK